MQRKVLRDFYTGVSVQSKSLSLSLSPFPVYLIYLKILLILSDLRRSFFRKRRQCRAHISALSRYRIAAANHDWSVDWTLYRSETTSGRSVTNLSDRKVIESKKKKEITTRNSDVNGNNNCAFVVFYFESVAKHDGKDMLTLFLRTDKNQC